MAPISATNSSINSSRSPSNGQQQSATCAKQAPQKYLTNCRSFYSCIYCRTHLANHDELISRMFQGNRGRAYLFNSVINTSCGPSEQRNLTTGSHAVADIFCSNCSTTLGWKYERAFVETQKYKEGKFIIELAHVVRENKHLELDKGELLLRGQAKINGISNSSSNNNNNNHTNKNSNNNNRLSLSSEQRNCQPGSSPESAAMLLLSQPQSSSPSKSALLSDEHFYDEELMFPFFDDICSSRSSFPSNPLASSQHNRMRRSLYLDSTPYDWKQFNAPTSSFSSSNSTPASASASSSCSPSSPADLESKIQPFTTKAIASSLGSSDLSSVSSSASDELSPRQAKQQQQQQTHRLSLISAKKSNICDYRRLDCGCGNCESPKTPETSDHGETQFEFEIEINSQEGSSKSSIASSQRGEQSDDQPTESVTDVTHSISSVAVSMIDHNDDNNYAGDNDNRPARGLNPENCADLAEKQSAIVGQRRNSNSISLEDEEFYDCFSEHDVSNMSAAGS